MEHGRHHQLGIHRGLIFKQNELALGTLLASELSNRGAFGSPVLIVADISETKIITAGFVRQISLFLSETSLIDYTQIADVHGRIKAAAISGRTIFGVPGLRGRNEHSWHIAIFLNLIIKSFLLRTR